MYKLKLYLFFNLGKRKHQLKRSQNLLKSRNNFERLIF